MNKPVLSWIDRSISQESAVFEIGSEIEIYESDTPIPTSFGEYTLFVNSWERYSNILYPAVQLEKNGKIIYSVVRGGGAVAKDKVILENFCDQ